MNCEIAFLTETCEPEGAPVRRSLGEDGSANIRQQASIRAL